MTDTRGRLKAARSLGRSMTELCSYDASRQLRGVSCASNLPIIDVEVVKDAGGLLIWLCELSDVLMTRAVEAEAEHAALVAEVEALRVKVERVREARDDMLRASRMATHMRRQKTDARAEARLAGKSMAYRHAADRLDEALTDPEAP